MAPHANAQERWGQALSLLDLAEERLPSDVELFKALLISAIVLGDSVRDLIHVQDARVPGFKFWEDQLEQRWPSLPLFREERNFAIVSVSPFVSASSFGEFGPVVHAEIITTTGV